MLVKAKLFATLQRYAPEGITLGAPFEVTLPEESTINDLILHLGINPNEVKVAFVEGRARSEVYELKPGDEVGIFPPVGGG
ncbi:MAG: MoaD/ThiS family protein [Anaerolineae bacterium]|jgi:sulfur carrier protein ThiS|nr:MoaD/ThiS family protein [Anaerolineae bacterium]